MQRVCINHRRGDPSGPLLKESHMNRTFRFSLATLAIATLAACGGGGGGGDAAPSSAAPVTSTPATQPAAPAAGPVSVTMTGLSIKAGDVLAQTASTTTTVSFLSDLLDRFTTKTFAVGNAYANGNDKVNPGNNFGFTNKIENGKLVTLNVKLKDKDGKDTKCDTSTAEVKIHKIWGINPGKGHLMVKATAPSVVNADCTVSYKDATYVVTEAGAAMEIPVDSDQIVRVIEAGDEARNSSDRAVLVYKSGTISTLTVNAAGSAVLQTLTNTALPIIMTTEYSFAFNGTHLVGISRDRIDTVLAFNVNDSSFKIISTAMAATGQQIIRPTGYGAGSAVFLTKEGTFVWHEYGNNSRQLNIEEGNYTAWAPAQPRYVMEGAFRVDQTPLGLYGLRGRSGTWTLSDRCVAWNYETGEWILPAYPSFNFKTATGGSSFAWQNIDMSAVSGQLHAKMEKGIATCVNDRGNLFSRLKISDMTTTVFDTDKLGFFFSAGRKFEIFQDKAMLWGAVSSSNGDVKVMELNFETGQVKDHGVISVNGRKVVELVPVGG